MKDTEASGLPRGTPVAHSGASPSAGPPGAAGTPAAGGRGGGGTLPAPAVHESFQAVVARGQVFRFRLHALTIDSVNHARLHALLGSIDGIAYCAYCQSIIVKEKPMAYVPVNIWVPDTAEGSVVESVDLKLCDTCHAPIPIDLMEDHIAKQHPTLEVTPH